MRTFASAGRFVLVAVLLVSLSGCASLNKWMPWKSAEEAKPAAVLAQTEVRPEPAPPRAVEPPRPTEPPAAQQPPARKAEPSEPTRRRPNAQPPPKVVSLNFEGAELEQVLRVLAELAGINFVLGQGVKAQVTMRIDRLPSTEAFSIMQALLEANNLALIKAGPIYKIVPAPAAQQQPASIGIGKEQVPGLEEGYLTQIVPLQFLSAEELVKVLQPLMAPGRVLAYREANSVILSGPASMVRRVLETIQTLDVQSQQKEAQQVFVYYVENAKAVELANVLTNLFGLAGRPGALPGAPPTRPPTTRPGTQPTTPPPTPARPGAPVPPPPTPPTTPEEARIAAEVRIVADERTNALIVKATQQDYKLIEETIRRLDIIPKQVLIEVLAAEITLTDSLEFGLNWVLRSGDLALSQFTGLIGGADFSNFINLPSDQVRGIAGNLQGFNATFVDGRKFRAFLNTLAAYTKINALATPHILTADNKEAKIQVGQEVPIVTGTQSTITAVATEGQNVFQSLQQRDVGRILTIKPHVNEKRQVTLDMQLEVSDILSLTTGTIGSPTFSKRTAQTSLVVEDGQSLLIAGIIDTRKRYEYAGVPWLSKIPVLGYLFRNTTESVEKTELFIMLTPYVVASPEEGKILTEQFRQRLDWVEEGLKRSGPSQGRKGGFERSAPSSTGKTSSAPVER
jgi:general secretion pathway protein D